MKLETTVRLTREEIEKPVRLTLNDGTEIVIVVDAAANGKPELVGYSHSRKPRVTRKKVLSKDSPLTGTEGSGLRPFVCEHCGLKFENKANRDRHRYAEHRGKNKRSGRIETETQRDASGARLFRCDPCGQTFHTRAGLEGHQVVVHHVKHTKGVANVQ